ncbi:uncharacterized protein [Mytilus edulis]|uniref:uncharacterized protein n=1 Tax=Mytilus edulis TaxID=6550 RepID=UPI0039EF7D0E
MASSKSIPRGPCQEGEVYNTAVIWCYNCNEGLCSVCSKRHKKFKGTHDHKTIDAKIYQLSIQTIKTECDQHFQEFSMYCPAHLIPCCDKCISARHSKCTGIQKLDIVVEKTKILKFKESVERDINSIILVFDETINNKSKNIKTGEKQNKRIKKSIKKIRKKINRHLDHLEIQLCQKTDHIWIQERSTATHLISEIEDKEKNLKELKEHLQTVTAQTSKLQTFLGVHQIEQQVHQYQQYVDGLENNDITKEFNIMMKQNEEMEKILSNIESLESLGEIAVVQSDKTVNREKSVYKKAQVKSHGQSNINNATMNIETEKIEMNMKKYITDIICLRDGRCILVEQYGKVNILDSDGKLQKQLPVSGKAWSATEIKQDIIAITYPREQSIKIFNMGDGNITKFITFDKQCWGLSFSNNSLAVGLSTANEIRIIDLEGRTLKSTEVPCESTLDHLVYKNDRVVYSDYNGNAVYCIDGSGKQIWQYTQGLEGPKGLCTDSHGNVIVAECKADRIILISKDGQESKVLISEEDGQEYLRCICVKHEESSGFICDDYGKYLARFKLSYG